MNRGASWDTIRSSSDEHPYQPTSAIYHSTPEIITFYTTTTIVTETCPTPSLPPSHLHNHYILIAIIIIIIIIITIVVINLILCGKFRIQL